MKSVGAKAVLEGADKFFADLQKIDGGTEQLAASLGKVAGPANAAGAALQSVGKGASQVAGQVDTANTALKATGTAAGAADKSMGSLRSTILGSAIGFAAAREAMGALHSVVGGTIGSFSSFEHEIDAVGAISGATSKEMGGLSDTALRIGRDTQFGAGEAAKAMEELAANGITTADIMNGAADASANLAAAGGTDLAFAAQTVSTAMAVWGHTTEQLTTDVNLLAGAANVSRFGVDDMAGAVAAGGGAAAAAGVSFGDFSAAIAATAANFSSGSDAGTSFKTLILSLTPSSAQAADEMKQLGIITADGANAFFDATGKVKSMADIVQVLHDKIGPLTQEQQLLALKTMFGTDAFRAAAGLMKLTGDEFTTLENKMANTSAADMAKIRMDNLAGSTEQLKGSLESLGISMGAKAAPALREMVDLSNTAVNAFAGLSGSTQALTLGTIAFAAAAPAAFSGISKIAAAIKDIGKDGAGPRMTLSGIALGIGAVSIAADAILQKTTGHGLIEWLFGDPEAADAAAASITRVGIALEGITDPATKAKIVIDALRTGQNQWRADLEALKGTSKGTFDAIGSMNRFMEGFTGGASHADQITADFTASVKALGQELVTQHAPLSAFTEAHNLLSGAQQKAFDSATNYADRLSLNADAIAASSRIIDDAITSMDNHTAAIYQTAAAAAAAVSPIDQFRAAAMAAAAGTANAANSTAAYTAELDRLFDSLTKSSPSTLQASAETALLQYELEKLDAKVIKTTDSTTESIKATKADSSALDAAKYAARGLSDAHEALGRVMDTQQKAFDDFGKGIDSEKDKLGELKGELSDAKAKLQGFLSTPLAEAQPFDKAAKALDTQMTNLELQINKLKQKGPLTIEVQVRDKDGKGSHTETQMTATGKAVEKLQGQLDTLRLKADQVDLEKKLKIDPLKDQLDALTDTAPKPFAAIRDGIKDALGEIDKLGPAITTQEGVITGLEGQQATMRAALDLTKQAYADLGDKVKDANQAVSDQQDAVSKAQAALDLQAQSLRDTAKEAKGAKDELNGLTDAEKAQHKAITDALALLGDKGPDPTPLFDALKTFAGPDVLGAVYDSFQRVGLSGKEVAIATGMIERAFKDAKTGGTDKALAGLQELQQFLGPMSNAWLTTAQALGPDFVRTITAGLAGEGGTALYEQMTKLGIDASGSMAVALNLGVPDNLSAGEELARAAVKGAAEVDGKFGPKGEQASADLATGVESGTGAAYAAGYDVGDQANQGVSTGVGDMEGIGEDAIDGFLKGLQSKADDVKTAVKAIVGVVGTSAKAVLKESSPSKVMFDIGAYATEGLALGLESKATRLETAAQRIANATVSAVSSSPRTGGGGGSSTPAAQTAAPSHPELDAAKTAVDALAQAYEDLGKQLDAEKDKLSELQDAFSKQQSIFDAARNTPILEQQPFTEKEKALDRQITEKQLQLAKLKAKPQTYVDASGKTQLTAAGKAAEKLQQAIEKLQNQAEQVRLEEKLKIGPLQDQLDALTKVAPKPFEEILREAIAAQAEMERLRAEIDKQKATVDTTEKAHKALGDELDAQKEAYDKLKSAIDAADEAMKKLADDASQGLGGGGTGSAGTEKDKGPTAIEQAIADMRNAIIDARDSLPTEAADLTTATLAALGQDFANAQLSPDGPAAGLQSLLDHFKMILADPSLSDEARQAAETAVLAITGAIEGKDTLTDVQNALGTFYDTVEKTMTEKGVELGGIFQHTAAGAVAALVDEFMNTKSPTTALENLKLGLKKQLDDGTLTGAAATAAKHVIEMITDVFAGTATADDVTAALNSLFDALNAEVEDDGAILSTKAADAVKGFAKTLADNLASGKEMPLNELQGMFDALSGIVADSGLDEEAKAAAQATIDAFVQGMKDGQGVANQAIIKFINDLVAVAIAAQPKTGGSGGGGGTGGGGTGGTGDTYWTDTSPKNKLNGVPTTPGTSYWVEHANGTWEKKTVPAATGGGTGGGGHTEQGGTTYWDANKTTQLGAPPTSPNTHYWTRTGVSPNWTWAEHVTGNTGSNGGGTVYQPFAKPSSMMDSFATAAGTTTAPDPIFTSIDSRLEAAVLLLGVIASGKRSKVPYDSAGMSGLAPAPAPVNRPQAVSTIAVTVTGNTFLGTPEENGAAIEDAVERVFEKQLGEAFAYGVSGR